MSSQLERTARALNAFNAWRLSPSLDASSWDRDAELASLELEADFLRSEEARVRSEAASVPRTAREFVAWFEELESTGPGQHDPLFDWLAETASLDEMTWFLQQEVAGEAGFDDLVALTQVKLPVRAKLELARNYWDEMGQGSPSAMHGPMLARLAAELEIADTPSDEVVWESLALSNLMTALATRRTHAYQSVGALGVIELTAPNRAALVNRGLRRLGIGGSTRQYFALHATLDVKHSAAWNQEVLVPLVQAEPRTAPLLAEGALLRLNAGARCFQRYCTELARRGVTLAA